MSKQRNGRQSVGLAPTSPLLRLPYHRNALPLSTQPSPMLNGRQNGFACLVELRVDEQASGNRRRPAIYPLPLHMGQVRWVCVSFWGLLRSYQASGIRGNAIIVLCLPRLECLYGNKFPALQLLVTYLLQPISEGVSPAWLHKGNPKYWK